MKPVPGMGFVVLRTMKSKRFTRFLLVLLIAIATSSHAAARSYGSTNPGLIARAEEVTGDSFPVVTTTPRGVTVFARTISRADLLMPLIADLRTSLPSPSDMAIANGRDSTTIQFSLGAPIA